MAALALVVGRCCWQLVRRCFALAYWTVDAFGQALRLGFAIIRPVKPASASPEEAAQLLAWVREQLPGRHVTNLGADWSDGLLLAELVNALAPRSVPPERLSPDQPGNNVALAVERASHLLKVDQTLSVAEVLQATNQAQLAAYLTQLRQSAQRLQRRFTLIKTESFVAEEPEPAPECTACGTGLVKAQCGRPAHFTVSLPRTGPMDLLIELRSDAGDFFTQRLTPRSPPRVLLEESLQSTLGARLAPNIPLGYQMRGKSVAVTYQPVKQGRLVVGVIHAGQHVPGSPFRLLVAPVTAEPETTSSSPSSGCQQELRQRPRLKSRAAERRVLTTVREASREDEPKTPPLSPVSKTQPYSVLTVAEPDCSSEQAASSVEGGAQDLVASVKLPFSDDTRNHDSDVFTKLMHDDISRTLNKATIDSSLQPGEGMECLGFQDIDTCTISPDESTIRHPVSEESCRTSDSTLNSQHCANVTERRRMARPDAEARAGLPTEQCLQDRNNDYAAYPANDGVTETGQHHISLRSDPDGMATPPLASALLVRAVLGDQQTKSKQDSSRSNPESSEICPPSQHESENSTIPLRRPARIVLPTPANQAVVTSRDRRVCPKETSEHAWLAATIPHDPAMVPEATEIVSIMDKHSHVEPSAEIITDRACVQASAPDGLIAKERPHSSTANEIHVNRSGQRANSDAANTFPNECPERTKPAALTTAADDASVQTASNNVGVDAYKLHRHTMKDASHLVCWDTFEPARNEPQMPAGSPARPRLIKQRTVGDLGSASEDSDGPAQRTRGAEGQSIDAAVGTELVPQPYPAEEIEVPASSLGGSDNDSYDGDIETDPVGSKIHAANNGQTEKGIAISVKSQGRETVGGSHLEGTFSLCDLGAETHVDSSTGTRDGALPQNDADIVVPAGPRKTDEAFFLVSDINGAPAPSLMETIISPCTAMTAAQSDSEKKEWHNRPTDIISGNVIMALSNEQSGTDHCQRLEYSSGKSMTLSPGNCGGDSDMNPTLARLPVAAHSLRHHPSTPGADPSPPAHIAPEDVATTARPGKSAGIVECDSSENNCPRTGSEDRHLTRDISVALSAALERCGTSPSTEGAGSLPDVPADDGADAPTVQLEGDTGSGSERIKCNLAESDSSQSVVKALENDGSQPGSREIDMKSCASQNLNCVRHVMGNEGEREIDGYQNDGGLSIEHLQNTYQTVPQNQGSRERSGQLAEQDRVEGREALGEQCTDVGAREWKQQDYSAKQQGEQNTGTGDDQPGKRHTEKRREQATKPDTNAHKNELVRLDTEECFRQLAEQYGVNEPVVWDTASNASSPGQQNANAGADQLKTQRSEGAGDGTEARDGGTRSDILVREVGLENSQPKHQCAGSAIEQELRLDTETSPHQSNSHETGKNTFPLLCTEKVSDRPENTPTESNSDKYNVTDTESHNHSNYHGTVAGDPEAELGGDHMETAAARDVVGLGSEVWQQTTSASPVMSAPGQTADQSSPNGPSPLPGPGNRPNLFDSQSSAKYIGETVVPLGRSAEEAQGLIEPQVLQFNQHKPYLQPGVVLETPSGIIRRRSGDIDSFPAVGGWENEWAGGERAKSPSRPSTTESIQSAAVPADRKRKFSDQYRQFYTPTESKYRPHDNQARSKVYLGLTAVRVRKAAPRHVQLLPCLLLPPENCSHADNADSQKVAARQISDKGELPDTARQSTKPSSVYPVHSDSPAPSPPTTPTVKETLPSGMSPESFTWSRETICEPSGHNENQDTGKVMSSAIDLIESRETCDGEFPANPPAQNPLKDSTERDGQNNALIDTFNHGNASSSLEKQEDECAPRNLFPRSKPPEKSAVCEEIIEIQDLGADDVILEAMILEPRPLKALTRSPDIDDSQQCLRESSQTYSAQKLQTADPNKSAADAPQSTVLNVPLDSTPQNERAGEESIPADMDDTHSETSSCGTLNTTAGVRDSSPEWSDSDSSRSSFQSVVSALQPSPGPEFQFSDVFEADLERALMENDKVATGDNNQPISNAAPKSLSASPSLENQQIKQESKSSHNTAAGTGSSPASDSLAEKSYPVSIVKMGSDSYSETCNEQAVSSDSEVRTKSASSGELPAEYSSTPGSEPDSALAQPHCQPVPLLLSDRVPHPLETQHSHNNDLDNSKNLISTSTIYFAPGSPPRERRGPVLLKYVRTNSDQGQFRQLPSAGSDVTPAQSTSSKSYLPESSCASPRNDSSPVEDELSDAGHKEEDGKDNACKVQSGARSQQPEDTPREKTVVNGKPNAPASCYSFGDGLGDSVMSSRGPSGRNWQLQPVKPLKTEEFVRALTRIGQDVPEALQIQVGGRQQPGPFTEFDFEERKRMLRTNSQHDFRPQGVPDEGLLSWGHVVRLRSKYEQLSEMRQQRHQLRGSRSMVNLRETPHDRLLDSEPPELVVVPLNGNTRWENRNGYKTKVTDTPLDALKQKVSVHAGSAPQGVERQQFPTLASQRSRNTPQEYTAGSKPSSGLPDKIRRSQSSWELASIPVEESRFQIVQQYFAAIRDGKIAPGWGSYTDLSDHSPQKASMALPQQEWSPEGRRQGRFDLDLVGLHRTLTTLARSDTPPEDRAEDVDSDNELLNVEETVLSPVPEVGSGSLEPRVMSEYPYLSCKRSRPRLLAQNLLKHDDLVQHSKEQVTVFGSGLYQGTVDANNRFLLFVPDAESAPRSVHVQAVHETVATRAELRYVWHRYHEVTYRVSAAGWYRVYVHMGGSASDVDIIVRIRR